MTEAVTPETIEAADSLQRDSMRAANAKLILDNPVFHEAFEGMRAQIVEALSSVDADKATASLVDTERLRLLVLQLQQLDRLKVNFISYVRVGEQADADLARQRQRLAAEQARLDAEENGIFARGMRQAQRVRHALTPRTQ